MNVPAVFQWFINEVLRKALNNYAYVHLNGILIYSQFREDHIG